MVVSVLSCPGRGNCRNRSPTSAASCQSVHIYLCPASGIGIKGIGDVEISHVSVISLRLRLAAAQGRLTPPHIMCSRNRTDDIRRVDGRSFLQRPFIRILISEEAIRAAGLVQQQAVAGSYARVRDHVQNSDNCSSAFAVQLLPVCPTNPALQERSGDNRSEMQSGCALKRNRRDEPGIPPSVPAQYTNWLPCNAQSSINLASWITGREGFQPPTRSTT